MFYILPSSCVTYTTKLSRYQRKRDDTLYQFTRVQINNNNNNNKIKNKLKFFLTKSKLHMTAIMVYYSFNLHQLFRYVMGHYCIKQQQILFELSEAERYSHSIYFYKRAE